MNPQPASLRPRPSPCTLRHALQRSLDALLIGLVGWVGLVSPSGAARAEPPPCAESFLDHRAPHLTNPKLTPKTRELCFSAFAVLHSGVTRTPLWVASHLTRDSVDAAKALSRVNAFHVESALPVDERATLQDFSRSGFDRGHLFASGDAPTAQAQQESFSLANMVPQNPDNNRHLWEGIESAVRTLARSEGELFVVSGPLFTGTELQQLNARVLVPTQLYKVVYSPRRQAAAAYLVDNAPGLDYRVISVAQAEQLAGINFFPTMPASVKNTVMALPAPRSFGRRSRR